MTFTEKELEPFVKSLSENELSDKTIESYLSDIGQFFNYLKENKITEIHKTTMTEYKKYMLYERFLAPTSVNRKISAIDKFLDFYEISAKTKCVKVQEQNYLENVVNKSDVQALVDVAKKNKDYRMVAIIKLLEMTGMRISEALQLKVTDIYESEVSIKGKGSKIRVVFIPNGLRKYLLDYCKNQRMNMKKASETDALFIGQRGPISRKSVDADLKRYAALAGVEKNKAHAHSFRHCYGKILGQNNVPINTIADLLGHGNISVTRIYLKSDKDELKNLINNIIE